MQQRIYIRISRGFLFVFKDFKLVLARVLTLVGAGIVAENGRESI